MVIARAGGGGPSQEDQAPRAGVVHCAVEYRGGRPYTSVIFGNCRSITSVIENP